MTQTQQPQHTVDASIDQYRGYSGLPPLAGILSMREAATTGSSVTESIDRLKRVHWSLKRLHSVWIARIHANGGMVRLHVYGNTRRTLERIGKLGCDLVNIDYPVDMEQARSQMGPQQTLAGNLDPVSDLRNGTPDAIVQSLEELWRQSGDRWIVGAGCEVVRDTPHENLRAMVQFARTHSTNALT